MASTPNQPEKSAMDRPPNFQALLRETIELATLARHRGNHPFGALLANAEGDILLRAENTVVLERDVTAHAELNLVRGAAREYSADDLHGLVLYSSTEPCPMCAGSIFWSGIGKVVYALSEERFYDYLATTEQPGDVFLLKTADVLNHGSRMVAVDGPHLEDEALIPHAGFW